MISVDKRLHLSVFVIASLAIALTGCGGSGDEAEPGAPASTGTPASAGGATGGVHGKVIYDGTPPERAILETEGDPKCFAMHENDPLLSDREVVGADGVVQWAFVYIKNPPAGEYPIPDEVVVLDQVGCRYVPHVVGVRVGQTLNMHNSDALLHNVRAITRDKANKPINASQPANAQPRPYVFKSPEMSVRMKCDIHPWMTAYTFAMAHPFFAVTNENGEFAVAGLPAGEYTLAVWHEAYGEQETTVTINGGETSEAAFTVTGTE